MVSCSKDLRVVLPLKPKEYTEKETIGGRVVWPLSFALTNMSEQWFPSANLRNYCKDKAASVKSFGTRSAKHQCISQQVVRQSCRIQTSTTRDLGSSILQAIASPCIPYASLGSEVNVKMEGAGQPLAVAGENDVTRSLQKNALHKLRKTSFPDLLSPANYHFLEFRSSDLYLHVVFPVLSNQFSFPVVMQDQRYVLKGADASPYSHSAVGPSRIDAWPPPLMILPCRYVWRSRKLEVSIYRACAHCAKIRSKIQVVPIERSTKKPCFRLISLIWLFVISSS